MAFKAISIIVTGKVQKVYFRALTRELAEGLGLKGLVRNQPNGSVYIEAEGEETQLNKLIEWCKKGPPQAIVDSVNVSDAEPKYYKVFGVSI
ncbi:MAG: acylphosphatase [Bacteroidetes bacterium]|nr:acylphosphatase [Bacteroidota bacterium]